MLPGEEVGIHWVQDGRGRGDWVCRQKPRGRRGAEHSGGSAASVEGLLSQPRPAPTPAAVQDCPPRKQKTGPEILAL